MKPSIDYETWIDEIFNRKCRNGHELEWSEDWDEKVNALPGDETLQLIAATFENAERDLLQFSVEQAALGLNYITNETGGLLYSVYDKAASLPHRRAAVRSMASLYRFFARRCDNCMSSQDETQNRLNLYCYMLWDAGALYLGGFKKTGSDAEEMADSVLYVLLEALKIPHLACQESALHGLGHSLMHCAKLEEFFQKPYSQQITDAIDAFIADPENGEKIRQYATNARTGQIQ